MVYDHLVKHNGEYYQPGEEVPETEEPLPFHNMDEISDGDITLETDAVTGAKTSGKRGRPKKAE